MSVRGVWQLKSVVLRYCMSGGSSSGVREYIQNGLVDFARRNPQLQLRTQQHGNRHPVAYGEYLDGTSKQVDLRNEGAEGVAAVLQALRDTATGRVRSLKRPVVSQHASVQGAWDPSTVFDAGTVSVAPRGAIR